MLFWRGRSTRSLLRLRRYYGTRVDMIYEGVTVFIGERALVLDRLAMLAASVTGLDGKRRAIAALLCSMHI